MKGWTYVISNKRMLGTVGVGYSVNDPQICADELNHTVAAPAYVVEYEMLIEDPLKIDQEVQKRLSANHVGKGWYRCSTEHAVFTIKQAAGNSFIYEKYKTYPAQNTQQQAEAPDWHEQEGYKYITSSEHAAFVKKYHSHKIAVDVDEFRAGFMYEKPGIIPEKFRFKQALMRQFTVGCFILSAAMLLFVSWMAALGVFAFALIMVPQAQKIAAKLVLQAALQDPYVYQIAMENKVLVTSELA